MLHVAAAADSASGVEEGMLAPSVTPSDAATGRADGGVWRRADCEYPLCLEDLTNPPEQLYFVGMAEFLTGPVVAVVGTRDATGYGLRATRAIVTALARAGVSVISGMARGIDAAAHRAALEVGGRTVAVLGTGIDVPYPTGHRELHELLSRRGLVLSENGHGIRAMKGAFPKRNRIIAALAPATIVIEAGEWSGALNTANQALDLGRTVAAVPGPIDSRQSIGTNDLLRNGATVIASVGDALSLVGVNAPRRVRDPELGDVESRLWKALANGGLDVDALCARAAVPAREALAAITSLEIMGLVECLLTGEVRRR
jgi:DNA processing protein